MKTMKRLLAAIALISFAFVPSAQAQQGDDATEVAPQIKKDWTDNFLDLSREEQNAIMNSPEWDQRTYRDMVDERSAEVALKRAAGGGDATGGCDLWFAHDPLNSALILPSAWEEFEPPCGAAAAVDGYYGPLNLPFDFCFYGTNYSVFYINTKGSLSFTAPICDWTPDPFPAAGYSQIAGYWQDCDFTNNGMCTYEILDNAAIITFENVGYWAGNFDKLNNFQIIITDGTSDLIPLGYNVGMLYQDMEWAHGDVGGFGGFNGDAPGIVGVDKATGSEGTQVGAFNYDNDSWDQPYGDDDGIHWLDDRQFFWKLCEDGEALANHPPVPNYNFGQFNGELPTLGCDTITICQNEVVEFQIDYLAPEEDQTISITYNADDAPLASDFVLIEEGVGKFSCTLIGTPEFAGVHQLIVTATDDGTPPQSITQTFTFQVLDFEPPAITIDGVLNICAGIQTVLTVSPDVFDYYDWSGVNGCQGSPICEVGSGGTVTVTAYLDGCTSVASVEVIQTPFFLCDLEFNPGQTICSNQIAEICMGEEYESYAWEIWENYPGDIVSTDTTLACFEVYGGTYAAYCEDDNGCEGRRIFVIDEIDFVPPEQEFDPFCDGLENVEVVFEGGYTNPAEGDLIIYLFSSDDNGWLGSFLQITIDGILQDPYPTLSSDDNGFAVFSFEMLALQNIVIEYISAGVGDENNSIQIFNCSNQNPITIEGDDLFNGIIWDEVSGCVSEEAAGIWTQESCPCDGSFSIPDFYNSVFTPCDYGTFNLTFTEVSCGISQEFEIEVNQIPDISSLIPEMDQDLCPGESTLIELDYFVVQDCSLDISWSPGGTLIDVAGDDLSATAGPYDECENFTVEVEVGNGCGSDTATLNVAAHQPIEISDDFVDVQSCDEGEIVLCVVDDADDCQTNDYDWSNGAANDNCATVVGSGEVTVEVSNACFSETASATVSIAQAYVPPTTSFEDCNGDDIEVCPPNVPAGTTLCWGTSSNNCVVSDCYTFTNSGTITLYSTDECGTEATEMSAIVTTPPTTNPFPAEMMVLCPGICVDVSPNSPTGVNYSWTMSSGNNSESLSGGDDIQFCSDQIPVAWLGGAVNVEVDISNPCGTASADFVFVADACTIIIPNVFSPNNDPSNELFYIDGLENWPSPMLKIFNRWGVVVFESDDYENDWDAYDVASGTYFYTLELTEQSRFEGHLTIFKEQD